MDKKQKIGMMDKEEIENWIGKMNEQIEGEMNEWVKERLRMERWVLNQVLTGKRGI